MNIWKITKVHTALLLWATQFGKRTLKTVKQYAIKHFKLLYKDNNGRFV